MNQRIKPNQTKKHKTIKKQILLIILSMSSFINYAQQHNDYRTNTAAANFSTAANWDRWDTTGIDSWVTAATAPTAFIFASGNTISIQTGHTARLNNTTLTIPSDVSMDVVGSLAFATTSTLTINGKIILRNTTATSIGSFTGIANTIIINGIISTFNNNGFKGANCSLPADVTTTGNRISSTLATTANYELLGTGTGSPATQASTGLPTTINNLILQGSGTKTLPNATQTVNGNLSIASGVNLTAPTTLNIAGNFTNDGTFTPGTGTVTMNGGTQTIGGSSSITFNNLTISNANGGNQKTASASVVVNGTLNLASANTSATLGALHIPSGFLDLGVNATVTGTGNITGTVRRRHVFAQTGNLLTFTGANQGVVLFDLPDQTTNPLTLYIKATTGSPISTTGCTMGSTPNPISRFYTIWREGTNWGSAKSSFRHYYLESEINGGAAESSLSVWKKTIDSTSCIVQELGKSNSDNINNFIGIARQPITEFISDVEGNSQIFAAPTQVATLSWNGSMSSDMTTADNWTPQGVPSAILGLVIPSNVTFGNNPVLPANTSLTAKYMRIEDGKTLTSGTNSTLRLVGDGQVFLRESGATFNQGTSTILIESGTTSSIAGMVTLNNLTVASGSELLVPGEAMLTIAGTFTNNGTIIANTTPNNTVIFSGTNQTIPNTSSGKAEFNNLTISGTTTVLPASLEIFGNFTNNGTFSPGSGTVTMKGGTQTISGASQSTFNNLIISSTTSTTVTSTSSIRLTGTLTTNDKFILASDVSGTASIGNSTGATITGNVTIQRFVPGGKRAFRFFAHPFNAATAISNMKGTGSTGIIITGSGAGMDASGSNNPSAFTFSEAGYDGTNNSGWTGFAATSETIALGAGIRALHRGAPSQFPAAVQANPPTPLATTIVWSGAVGAPGNRTFSMLRSGGAQAGWNLIGNPYPSAVNIGLIAGANRNNIGTGNAWNPNLATAGGYETITFGTDYILPSGGAFFINTPSAATFTFTEADKCTATPASLFKNDELMQNALELKLISDSSIHWDNFVLRNRSQLTDAFEYTADGLKMKNSNVNVYSISSDNKNLSIDNRALNESKEVNLAFETSSPYHFTFKVSHIQMAGLEIYLEDKFTNQEVLLTQNTAYDFVTTADAASQGSARFKLKFKNAPTTSVTELNTTKPVFSLYPNPASSTIHLSLANPAGTHTYAIYNQLGMLLQSGELNYDKQRSHAINIESLANGIYFVKLDGGQVIRFAK